MTSARTAGLEVPVFAIPRDGDLGCGDTRVVHELIDLAAELRLHHLTILPIQETVRDNDPASAISIYALDPILLDVDPAAVEDASPEAYQRIAATSEASGALAYGRVKKAKLDLLWQAFEQFWEKHFLQGTSRARAYHRFCRSEQNWLPDYALFRLLMDFEQGSEAWQDWNDEYARYGAAKRFLVGLATKKPEAVERQLAFYAYVQWIADDQWRRVRTHAERMGVRLITDLHCAISPDSADFFRSPSHYRMEMIKGRRTATCRTKLLGHLEARLRRQASFFDQFRIADFRQSSAHAEKTEEDLRAFLDRLPDPDGDSAAMHFKVDWQSPPSLPMRSAQLWPAPNGHLLPPEARPLMSFSSFGTDSLRRLWTNDPRFRSRLKNQWAVNPERYDARTTLSLLRKLFQHPAPDVQISYMDLAGLENNPSDGWLTRYPKGPHDLRQSAEWEDFRTEFHKILEQTSRTLEPSEKAVESV